MGVIEALDRQEKMPAREGKGGDDGKTWESAIGQIRKEYEMPVGDILALEDMNRGMKGFGREEDARAWEACWVRDRASD